ncbi:MAG: PTS fructose transporter subunit IIC [Anaerolineaceae bacterium]|nr:PTS fructose transporter subunit IIC [Anaerolineaceae bacterium]
MSKNEAVKEFFGDLKQHLMTGISYMIPVIIIFALFMVLSQIPGSTQALMTDISKYAQMLIVPIMTVFIAFSIAGKLTVAPAFVIGLMADQMGMGFIGGLIIGLLTGYMVKLVIVAVNKIGSGQVIDLLASFLVVPIFVTLIMGALTYFVFAAPISSMIISLTEWLNSMSSTNAIVLAAILGAMIAVDMGGPINKTAFAFAVGAYTEGAYAVSAPVLVAISIPTLAMALAPFLAPKKYSDEEKGASKTAIVMGLIGLTEGAIPFAAVDPFRVIPSIIIGSSMGAAMAAAFGISNKVMIPALIGMSGINKPLLYLVCHIVPVLITALLVNLLKKEVPEEEME